MTALANFLLKVAKIEPTAEIHNLNIDGFVVTLKNAKKYAYFAEYADGKFFAKTRWNSSKKTYL